METKNIKAVIQVTQENEMTLTLLINGMIENKPMTMSDRDSLFNKEPSLLETNLKIVINYRVLKCWFACSGKSWDCIDGIDVILNSMGTRDPKYTRCS